MLVSILPCYLSKYSPCGQSWDLSQDTQCPSLPSRTSQSEWCVANRCFTPPGPEEDGLGALAGTVPLHPLAEPMNRYSASICKTRTVSLDTQHWRKEVWTHFKQMCLRYYMYKYCYNINILVCIVLIDVITHVVSLVRFPLPLLKTTPGEVAALGVGRGDLLSSCLGDPSRGHGP